MASPNLTQGVTVISNVATLAAGATSGTGTTTFNAGDLEYRVQLKGTFGTTAATYGLQVNVYQIINGVVDTVLFWQSPVMQGSSTQEMSFVLPAGNYSMTITNLDATNAVTNVSATMDKLTQ